MRTLALCLLLVALTSCGDDATRPPGSTGKVEVYVHWNGGVPNKQVEILETGDSGMTDIEGRIQFDLPAGTYTVRAYEIGTAGPGLPYVDHKVAILSGETTRVEIFDCQACD